MENTPKKDLLSKETKDLFILGARLITDDWVKYKVICDLAGISTLDEALNRAYGAINWTDRASVLPIVPTLEFLYSKIPSTMLHIPRKLDESLAKDGYRMKKGKLIRLKL